MILFLACRADVHDQFQVLSGDAVLPVAVHGNPDSGLLILFEAGGPSGPSMGERWVDGVDFRDTLEQEALVAMYDRRGVGNAYGGYRGDDLTLDALVEDLHAVSLALTDRYDPDTRLLMGHSFGGLSSLLYLQAHPDTFDAWVPVAPAWLPADQAVVVEHRRDFACRVAETDDGPWEDLRAWCAANPTVTVETDAHRELYEHLNAILDLRDPDVPMAPGDLTAAFVASHYNFVDATTRKNRISEPIWRDAEDVIPLDLVPTITTPRLIVTGEYDGLSPTEAVTPLSPLQIEGGGHYPFHADPQGFADAVLRLAESRVTRDPDAREAMVRALGPLVLGMCRRASHDPEDAFQAIWEKVFRSLPRFDPDGPAKLSTWVAVIAHRHLVDHHRAGARRVMLPLPTSLASGSTPEDDVARAQEADRLDAALQALPADLQRLVVGHHLGGIPLPDLVEVEGVPLGTLKSRLHRARALLAHHLREGG